MNSYGAKCNRKQSTRGVLLKKVTLKNSGLKQQS